MTSRPARRNADDDEAPDILVVIDDEDRGSGAPLPGSSVITDPVERFADDADDLARPKRFLDE